MVYSPTLDEVRNLASRGNLIPLYREIPADMETPVTAYLKVARTDPSFLLESVEGGERLARYSFIGTEPYRVLRTGSNESAGDIDPLVPIETELTRFRPVPVVGLPRFLGGAVGFIAYDAVRHFEPRLPSPNGHDPMGLPESMFMFSDTLLVFDHVKHTIKVVSHVHLEDGAEIDDAYSAATGRIDSLVERLDGGSMENSALAPGPESSFGKPVGSNHTRESFMRQVEEVRELITAGECIQVVLSQRLERPTSAAPFDIYRALRALNPSPYMYFLDMGDFHIIGSSPELLVRVEDGVATTHPIAGTRPRGETPEQDDALAEELVTDEKERAEHIMLVDLGRNDIGRVSEPGSVTVDQLMEIERYSHVMHIVSNVTGGLRSDLSSYDALRACFPAGTLSGAPKVRAMEIIAEKEPHARGPYGGAVGYFSFSGNMDVAICIRTVVMKDGVATVQAGGGLVYDSIPEAEYEESLAKAQGMIRAIDEAEIRSRERFLRAAGVR
ncbi:MAG: anthranilate synthase component I [Dehalococcoidia bacterium]|jgi:anthranilate synthase component 1|nr:anthranilate synthase component I [Dehalococcoidia bacterium]